MAIHLIHMAAAMRLFWHHGSASRNLTVCRTKSASRLIQSRKFTETVLHAPEMQEQLHTLWRTAQNCSTHQGRVTPVIRRVEVLSWHRLRQSFEDLCRATAGCGMDHVLSMGVPNIRAAASTEQKVHSLRTALPSCGCENARAVGIQSIQIGPAGGQML